jgi:hypothetical protein
MYVCIVPGHIMVNRVDVGGADMEKGKLESKGAKRKEEILLQQ